MLWIGLTGGLGTGKSTVAKYISEMNIPVIDADELARRVLDQGQPAYEKVVTDFGNAILNPDQTINRKALADIVFKSKTQLLKLESIVHPEIKKRVSELKNQINEAGYDMAFYDVPLLFEKNMIEDFDLIVVVASNLQSQKNRLQTRNSWTENEIENRLAAQLPLNTKIDQADFIIDNNGTIQELKLKVASLILKIKEQSNKIN